MKSLKTYNMDQDVINILRRKQNKSLHVNKCVRIYEKNRAAFDKYNLDTKELIQLLIMKPDITTIFKQILNEEWAKL